MYSTICSWGLWESRVVEGQLFTGSVEWERPHSRIGSALGSDRLLPGPEYRRSSTCQPRTLIPPLLQLYSNPSFSPPALPCLVSERGNPSSASMHLYFSVLNLNEDLNLCIFFSMDWGRGKAETVLEILVRELKEIKLPHHTHMHSYIQKKQKFNNSCLWIVIFQVIFFILFFFLTFLYGCLFF